MTDGRPSDRRPSPGELLELVFSPQLLELLDEHVREVAVEATRKALLRQELGWLTVKEAARREGVSARAIQKRVERGTVVSRRQGKLIYVRADNVRDVSGDPGEVR